MAGVADFIRKKLQQANTRFVAAQQNHPTFARLVSGINNAGDFANRINTNVANSPVGRFGSGIGLGAIDTAEKLAPIVIPGIGMKRILAGQKIFQPSKFSPAVTASMPQPTNTAQRVAGQAGQFIGKQLPYMALAEGIGIASGGAKVLSKLGKLAPAARSVTRAAVSNAAYSGLTAATDGQSAKDVAKKTALGLVTGVPMGAAGLLPNIGGKKIIGAIPRALAGAGANALAAKATGADAKGIAGAAALGLLEGPLGQGGERVAVKRTTAPGAQFAQHEDIQLASKDVSRAGVEAAKKNIIKQVNLGAKGYEAPILVARNPEGGLTVVNSMGKRGDETLQAYKELGMRPPINAPKDVNYLYSGPGKQFNEMDKNNPGTVPKHILEKPGMADKPYIIPGSNSTDVTKLSEKDLESFGKRGYTSITDRYGNTRNIKPFEKLNNPVNPVKEKQLEIIKNSNPAPNDQNVWVRTTDDIKSPEEAFMNANLDENYAYPDFTQKMGEQAYKSGKIKIYSSYPIKDGVFVTPSEMQAREYAGGKKPYSKEIDINDVAWIHSDEGQYAKLPSKERNPLVLPKNTKGQAGFFDPAELIPKKLRQKLGLGTGEPQPTAHQGVSLSPSVPNTIEDAKLKQLELAQLNEGIAQHPGKNALDEAALQVQTAMENAQAGARYFKDGQVINSSKSSFPDWVPESLRKKDLFNKVTEHLANDTVPTKAGRVKELYDIAHQQIVDTAKASPHLDEYHRMLDYKANLENDIKTASTAKPSLAKQTATEPIPASTAAQEGKIVLAKPDAASQTANTKVQSLASSMERGSKSLGKSVPTVSDFYNVDRMAVPNVVKQQVKGEIANAKEQLTAVVGHTLSNKEVADLAAQTSRVLDKTVTREQTAAKIAANLKLRQSIADAAVKGTVGNDFIEMWMKDKAAGEDIARQLQARSIIAKPEEAKAIDAILQGVYKVNKNAEEVAAAARNVDFNDPKAAAEFYRSFVKPKAGEWIDLLRYNSMLSSPNTHFNNIFSNFGQTGLVAPIEKTVTGMVDAARAALTGSPRQQFVGEGAAYAKGYYTSVAKATQAFTDSMRGKSLTVNPDIRFIPLALKGPAKAVESVLAVPTKLLEASDQFFTALTSGGVESSLKYRASKGVAVSDIAGKANEEAAHRLFRGDTNVPQEGHLLKAFDQVTNLVQSARQSDNPIVSTISKFTLPFVRTPMNIFKQSVEYSPLGVTTLWGATNKTEQLSKAILGSSAAAGVATLLGSNRLTWAEPTNSDQKAAYRQAGMQPYSVRIGDKWYSYAKLPPALAFNFALVASVDNAIKEKKLGDETADVILNSFAKYANFIADQSYVKNIGDFVAGTKGDVQGFAKTLSNYPQQLIPFRALGSWIERLIDPVQRQADPNGSVLDKQMQQIMMQIPGLAQKVPTRNDSAGNPLPSNNRLRNAFSPIKVSDVNPEGEKAFNTLKSISAINQQQKAETDKLKELAKQGNVDALMQLTKAQRTALKNSQEEDAIRATLSPVENAVYGLSKTDQEALLAQQPDLAPTIAKVNALKGGGRKIGGGVKTSLTSKKLKGITLKKGKKGRKPKTFKTKTFKLGSIKAKKLTFKAPKMKKISLKVRKGKKYGIKRA